MEKLLESFRRNPCEQTANKVRAHNQAHMMAACLLLPSQTETLKAALMFKAVQS